MFLDILILIAWTFLPFLELRAAIPYGIFFTDLHWSVVYLVCVATNIVVGPVVYVFLDKCVPILLRFKLFEKYYNRFVEKPRKKVEPYVEKYGEIGVALFIGVPLPGTGSYSGALGSYLLGVKFKKFIVANILGVFIAGTAVLIACLTGSGLMKIFIKQPHAAEFVVVRGEGAEASSLHVPVGKGSAKLDAWLAEILAKEKAKDAPEADATRGCTIRRHEKGLAAPPAKTYILAKGFLGEGGGPAHPVTDDERAALEEILKKYGVTLDPGAYTKPVPDKKK